MAKITRQKRRVIKIGNLCIGGTNPIAIQSMTKTKTADIEKTIRQIKELEKSGCEIVRLAVRDSNDAKALKKIKQHSNIPVVADIHFNWKLACEAVDNGADKIRLNPGNISKEHQIREIVYALKLARKPLRIGINSGSVKDLNSERLSMPDKLVASALKYLRIVEKLKFYDIVISLKASGVWDTIEAYRKISKLCDYPLHLGVTATGLSREGMIKSSIAIGALLLEGIGDTIRVSLTDKPQEEVRVAKSILQVLRLRCFGPEIISCPTCGRCEVDLIGVVHNLEKRLSTIDYPCLSLPRRQAGGRQGLSSRPLKVAIMGCVVNGPGEAKDADLGVAFGRKEGLLFKNGRAIKKILFSNCIDALLKEMEKDNVRS